MEPQEVAGGGEHACDTRAHPFHTCGGAGPNSLISFAGWRLTAGYCTGRLHELSCGPACTPRPPVQLGSSFGAACCLGSHGAQPTGPVLYYSPLTYRFL